MSDELKPCKHCGGEARFQIFDTTCNVECRECGIGTRNVLLDNYQEYIDKWNRSTDDAQAIENAENYNLRPGIVCQFIPTSEKHDSAANDNLPAETTISADGHDRNDTETTDSRERLESDVRWQIGHFFAWDEKRKELVGYVLGWLDRQSAITERELCDRCSPYATARDYLDTIDSLTAERDGLRKQLAEKQRVIDVQRDSFAKMERECAELRQMLAYAAETI